MNPKTIRIRTRARGSRPFRRAGVSHSPGPFADWPAGQFSPEQIQQLQAEPMIDVEILDQEQETAPPPAPEASPAPAEEAEAAPTETPKSARNRKSQK